jgi:hypothetical protein
VHLSAPTPVAADTANYITLKYGIIVFSLHWLVLMRPDVCAAGVPCVLVAGGVNSVLNEWLNGIIFYLLFLWFFTSSLLGHRSVRSS